MLNMSGPNFEPIRNWLVGRYLHDPDAKTYAGLGNDPITFDRFSEFTNYLVSIGAEVLPTLARLIPATIF